MEVTFIDMYGYICSNKSKLIKNKMCVCVCVCVCVGRGGVCESCFELAKICRHLSGSHKGTESLLHMYCK